VIGIDTNVLVRYLVQDDPKQAKAATKLIEHVCSPDNPGFLNHIVLCELVWVLKRSYKQSKASICQIIVQLIRTDRIVVEDIQLVWKALETFKETKADFSDCLLAQRNLQAGGEYTATLDDAASESGGYLHLLSEQN
jgi:predicted nucleic-acid-binding protein